MRVIGPSSEDEMVALFLRTELASARFGHVVRAALDSERADETLVTEADLSDPAANAARRRVLGLARGYRRDEGLFGGFPDEVRWERVGLTVDDLRTIRYIDYDYWVELAGGSRLALDGARNARAGVAPFDISSEGFHAMADALAAGATAPELLIVTSGPSQPLVVLEGHVRLTAYLLRPDAVRGEVEALLGTSPALARWPLY